VTCVSTTAHIALGSNLGDRRAILTDALAQIARLPATAVVSVSAFIETKPVGPGPQGDYLNAAAELLTDLNAAELLAALLAIERSHGRDRAREQRWGARRLDLDLLLFGDVVIDAPGLTVPHPRMHERAFVLEPLASIAPNAVHPRLGISVAAMAGVVVHAAV
jgi:2-amino-4-hydroxy-6-hydroxymethyldihydropteridine diphosphokinase